MENRRINLLFIVNSLTFGGAEKHVVTLLNHLNTARFRITLAWLKPDETLLPQLDQKRLEGGAFCCHVASRIDMRAVRLLGDRIRDDAIDVVVCTNNYSLLYGWLARLAPGRRRHAPRMVEIFHTTEIGSMRGTLEMLFYRPLFLASHMLVYVCDNQRAYWRGKALRARSDTVVRNGIDIDHFTDRTTPQQKAAVRREHGFAKDDYLIGLCAAMRSEKAHADLLQALLRLRAAGVPAKCLLIGDGPERVAIEQQAEALGLSSHVAITGFLSDVRPAVAACDVMAIVSHHVETFSIAALEAMALGKPMVMSRIGGAPEQVSDGDNGYLFRRGDIAALTDALRKLSDPQTRQRMGARGRFLTAQRFSVDLMVDAYADLFARLVQSPLPGIEDFNAA
jgi:glycosyltransferase involved in cell wall biosynthesis